MAGLLVFGGTIAGLYLDVPRPAIWLPLVWIGPFLMLTIAWRARTHGWRRAQFAGREILSDDEIFERFFSDAGLARRVVLLQWYDVARALRVEPGKLRPTDRFDRELACVPGWELYDDADASLDALFAAAARRLKEAGGSVVLSDLDTLDKFVRCLAAIEVASSQFSGR